MSNPETAGSWLRNGPQVVAGMTIHHQPINHEPTPSQGLCIKCGVAVGWRVEGKCSTCLTTLDHINTLRSLAESLSAITTHGWSDQALAVEAAADHLDDLAERLSSAEDDNDILHHRNVIYTFNLKAVGDWLDWARTGSEVDITLRRPQELQRETNLYAEIPFCPTCKTSHRSAPCQNREEDQSNHEQP